MAMLHRRPEEIYKRGDVPIGYPNAAEVRFGYDMALDEEDDIDIDDDRQW